MSLTNAQTHGSINPTEYHDADQPERGHPDYVMTRSQLCEFMRSPSRWHAGYTHNGSKSTQWGDLLDAFLLTPARFKDQYKVIPATYHTETLQCPGCGSQSEAKSCRKCKRDRETVLIEKPWEARSNHCREWLEQNPHNLSAGQHADLINAGKRLHADPVVGRFLEASETQILVTGTWQDKTTGLDVPLKALLDLVPRLDSEFAKSLGDLKTTRTAQPRAFPRHAYQFGYHVQAAFYTDLYVEATGEDRCNWCCVLSENYEPWEVGRQLIGTDFVEMGRKFYRMALALYAHCLEKDHWPTADDLNPDAVQGWSVAVPEVWMDYDALSLSMQADTAAAKSETDDDLIP